MTEADTELEQVSGQLYHDQMLKEYWRAGERITLNAMVMLCLAARRFDGRVRYVLLDDSDQGDWQTVAGLAADLPEVAGEYSEALDLDIAAEFDDEGWASSIDCRTSAIWEPFCAVSGAMPLWRFLDVDKVLAEIDLPWRAGDEAGG